MTNKTVGYQQATGKKILCYFVHFYYVVSISTGRQMNEQYKLFYEQIKRFEVKSLAH
jgi:cytochrome b subunit of formate dehydrogenase